MLRKDIDLKESYTGDLIIDGNDIADTSDYPAMTYYQIIRMLLNTDKLENLIYPALGINFNKYYGGPNTPDIGFEIAKLIKIAIAENTDLYMSEIEVAPFPIGQYTIAFKITLHTVEPNPDGFVVAYNTQDNMVKSLNFS